MNVIQAIDLPVRDFIGESKLFLYFLELYILTIDVISKLECF